MYGVEGCQHGNTADYPRSSLQTYNIATDRETPSTKQVYEKKKKGRKEGGGRRDEGEGKERHVRSSVAEALHANFIISGLMADICIIRRANSRQRVVCVSLRQPPPPPQSPYTRPPLLKGYNASQVSWFRCAPRTRRRRPAQQFRHVHRNGRRDAMLKTIKSYQGTCQ